MQISEVLRNFINEHQNDDVRKLLLQKNKYPDIDIPFAVQQIEGRKKALEKFPEIAKNENFIYPQKESMEQCSSEHTARYKASLIHNATVADITGGLGIDSFYFAETNNEVFHIERNPELQAIASHNFSVFKKDNIESNCVDAIDFLRNTEHNFDLIYLDPARRDKQKQKVFLFRDCEPNIIEHAELFFDKAKKVLIKASPFLDISKAVQELENVAAVHIVSVKNECKELLFEWGNRSLSPLQIHCINIIARENIQSFSFPYDEEKNASIGYSNEVLRYIYEPNTSIIKSGGFKSFGNAYNLKKLHPNSHLYTSDELIGSFQGRSLLVEEVFALDKKEIGERLPDRKANVIVRNFPMSVDEIKTKFRIKDGGDTYLYFTTLNNERKVVVKTKRLP
ncbi:class I SAM-dependent methyltransferase [Bacteroidales bacterium OttesenSCG-928-C19]|nr:class I SAM-dependent methyltransferase [Bacteroidales bacterium OttesenSCG-928-C19]